MIPSRIAAFSDGNAGGNPAGVVIADNLPPVADMQQIAKDIGYSETAFAARDGAQWRVRYFAPEKEVPFCGHATIALGVALGKAYGAGRYDLALVDGPISVTAMQADAGWSAALQSPRTWSSPLPSQIREDVIGLFGFDADMLDPRLPATLAFAGARHAVIALKNRADVAAMAYDFAAGKAVMAKHDLTTISLLHIVDEALFVSRNAFAIGGVVEDAATGAAAAALGGALVDLAWPALSGGGRFTIRQGEDMGQPSVLHVTVTGVPGDSVQVSGTARMIA